MKLPKILRPILSPSSGSPISSPKSPRSARSLSPKPSLSNLFSSPPRAAAGSSSTGASGIESELAAVFRQFDSNGDGKISAPELESVLRCLGQAASEEEVGKMMQAVDMDGDGFISLEEFIRFNGAEAEAGELRAVFGVFDLDQNGFISPDELHRVLVRLGETGLTMEECGRMIRGVDSNGDGRVDFEEFKVMMMANA